MRSNRKAAFALAAALSACLVGVPAAAQPAQPPAAAQATKPLSESLSGMAKAEYEAGKILYADKDYANAIVKFSHAYELSHEPRLLWNIAVCEKNLRRYTRMLDAIQRYRKDAGPVLTDQDRANADELVKTVQALVSSLKVTVTEEGADIFVDEQKIGVSPLKEPVLIDVGTRRFKVTKKGFKDFVKTQDVVGAQDVSLAVMLEKEVHQGRLVVEAGPKDMISIDGKAMGLGRWEGSLPSGGHTLRVTAPGMAAYQSEVVIQDDKERRVPVTLETAKSNTATILWVSGGALLAAAAVVGGLFLIKNPEPTSTTGTLGTVQLSHGIRWGGSR